MSREIPTEEEYTKYFLAIRAQMRRCGGAWRSYLRFFLSTWQAVGYKFRVYMTRRCFNLNEMLFTLYCYPWTEKDWRSIFADGNFIPREGNTDKREQSLKDVQKTFITQSALLGYVRSITQEYYEKGVFPKILIVDELAIYAKQIRVFLQEFESAILYVWRGRTATKHGGTFTVISKRPLTSACMLKAGCCRSPSHGFRLKKRCPSRSGAA